MRKRQPFCDRVLNVNAAAAGLPTSTGSCYCALVGSGYIIQGRQDALGHQIAAQQVLTDA